jgi:hypothetical protein
MAGQREWAHCDCCEKYRPLSLCWAHGLETWACDECRGLEQEDDSDRVEYETGGQ